MPNYTPDLNSPKAKKIYHGLEGQGEESRKTIWEAFQLIRSGNVPAGIDRIIEGLDDLSELQAMIHKLGKQDGYKEVEEILARMGLDKAQLIELVESKVDEDEEK